MAHALQVAVSVHHRSSGLMTWHLVTLLLQALTKVTVGQLTLFPVYTSTLFMYLGVLEGKSWQQSWQRLEESFPETFTTGDD
jgi:hypothetical protein